MNRFEKRLKTWHEDNPMVFALVFGVASWLILDLMNFAFPGLPALRALYILPIWIGTRLGGRIAGIIIVGLATLSNVWMDYVESGATNTFGGLIWFSVFGIVMLLVAQVEDSLHRNERLAHQDALTGLYNRRGLEMEGKRLLGRMMREQKALTVVMIDCDRFKRINDDFGHKAGDDALRFLAQTLEDNTRDSDVLSRLGGDEFVLMLAEIGENEAASVMRRIQTAFEAGMAERGYDVSLSIGLAALSPEASDLRTLVSRADVAMYRLKEDKRGHLAAG